MQFVKMHGLGNDFVLVDQLGGPAEIDAKAWSQLAVAVCDRHFGVGADGVLLLLPSEQADVRMRIFNADGSEAESCGNGIRCLGRYYRDRYAPGVDRIRVQTGGGLVTIFARADGAITVDMGRPAFRPQDIPVAVAGPEALDVGLEVDGQRIPVGCVSMGNPHAVSFVAAGELDDYPLSVLGPQVEHHPWFPRRVNFEVAEIQDRGRIRLRVWERGAGLTLACGTGACATVAVAHRRGLVDRAVEVELPGGRLHIEWDGQGSVLMTGPADYVFAGSYANGPRPAAASRAGGEEQEARAAAAASSGVRP